MRLHGHVWGLSALLVVGVLAGPTSAQELTTSGVVKLGVEADTNPLRLNGVGSNTDTVERLFTELAVSSTGADQVVGGSVRIGAKLFNRTRDENTLVYDGVGQYRRRLFGDLGMALRISARDRTERGHARDYVRLGLRLGPTLSPEPVWLQGGASVEYFLYRPNADLSYLSPGVFGQAGWTVNDVLSLNVFYTWAQRAFGQEQVISDALLGLRLGQDQREDWGHQLGGGLRVEAGFVGTADIYWQRNQSNSYGKAFSRVAGRLSATVPLPLDLFVTGQLSVQRTSFDDQVLIDPTLAIDEENRNSLVLALSGDVTDWLAWEVRYSFYTQAFGGDDEDYRRHLIYGGLVATAGN